MQKTSSVFTVVCAALLFLAAFTKPVHAGAMEAPTIEAPTIDWFTGEGVSLGGVLFPHIHAAGVIGASTASEIDALAAGHHDPQTKLTLQALELGVSLRLGDSVEGFAVYSAWTDADGELDGELEEAFLKLVKLPGGFELRGGRFFNRFGFQSALHNHAWDFVNQNLANGRILQEGELITEGGEITWNVPTPFRSALSFSLGDALTHDEEHGHGEEAQFEADGGLFDDLVFGLNYIAQMDYNDFHQNRVTLSAAWGDNAFGRSTQILGIGYEYLWREKGYEKGGAYFRWRNEGIFRRIGAVSGGHEEEHEEHEEEGHDHHDDHDEEHPRRDTLDEVGFYTSVACGFNDHVETGVRVGYVSGIGEMGLDRRWRVSPNVTVSSNAQRTVFARVQYDFDHSADFGDEHSVWFQIGFNWGGPEVR